MELYDRIVDPDLLIRRVNIVAANLIKEDEIPEEAPFQLDLFTDYEALEREKKERAAAEDRERRIQRATLDLQEKYGKNAVLKGMNLMKGGTTIERNQTIGGHRSGEPGLKDKKKATRSSATVENAKMHTVGSDGLDDMDATEHTDGGDDEWHEA